MANGYVIGGAAILLSLAFAGSNLWSYRHGQSVERGRNAELIVKANDAAILAARANALNEEKRRSALAVKQQRAEAVSREAKLRGQIHALKSNRPECQRGADDLRLLNDAIQAGNR